VVLSHASSEVDDPPVLHVETHEAARYPEAPAQVARHRRRDEQCGSPVTIRDVLTAIIRCG